MAKEFKTIDELVGLLESRHVKTDADTRTALMRESYYAVVNGYKDPFLDREAMQSSSGDVYVSGTCFSQIYDLYRLDRELRLALFPYLTEAEGILKNATVYAFCHEHPEPTAYLDRSCYADSKSMLVPRAFRGNRRKMYEANLSKLMSVLYDKVTPSGDRPMRVFVEHYLNAYGFVPLWVLQNDLTFGNMSHFFQLQRRGVQNEACRIVQDVSGRSARIQPIDLLRAYSVLVEYRNICAHDERLYCACPKGATVGEMLRLLHGLIPDVDATRLGGALSGIVNRYAGQLPNKVVASLRTEMSKI